MIAVGIALISTPLIVAIAATVWVMGWKLAAFVWGTALVATAALMGGAWLLATGAAA
ncbi:hypothetical protein [Streptosporangium sp. NPDC004631]